RRFAPAFLDRDPRQRELIARLFPPHALFDRRPRLVEASLLDDEIVERAHAAQVIDLDAWAQLLQRANRPRHSPAILPQDARHHDLAEGVDPPDGLEVPLPRLDDVVAAAAGGDAVRPS